MSAQSLADTSIWLVVLAASVGTFAIRLSFVALFGRLEEVPPGLERALKFVPAAVLTALVAPRLVYLDGTLALGVGNDRLLAGALAAVVAWRTESMLWTIVAGMAALWTLKWLALGL
ncbi:AzlD domain-containing protein [Halorussus caseinilyticus]|uniref:AzlD domain-containing protein n=1 Tax=Halorussus caseinilyticus TaxID=3034025 RepID=A0ABD5WSX3_9EURY|nr:AzlD domain-containing protein [Halorussus sp. DT72]